MCVSLQRHGILILVVLYILLGSVYSIITPAMEASDELWHYPMVKYIADHWALPVQDPETVGPWRQEGSQPPLYYFVGALLTAWIDTSDLEQARWVNPHADNGIVTEDGNTNLIIHRPANELRWGNPGTERAAEWAIHGWHGTVLAIHLIRLVSVWMGAGTVYLSYLLVLEVWPARKGLALAAAAITAFNPMFCFISGAVNNDNLATLLCALGIWLLVRLAVAYGGETPGKPAKWWRDVSILGGVLGLGALTKSSALGLLPLTALTIGYIAWKRRSWWHLITGGAVTAGLVLVLSGWWFARNALLYDGDWLGIERFIVILGYRVPPATWRELWRERHSFMMAYWGLFGGVNVPLPQWVYQILNGSLLVAAAGLFIGAARWIAARQKSPQARQSWRRLRASVAAWIARPQAFQLALLILWPLAVLIPWALWAMRTWSSQGRLVFSALSVWSIWMALGLDQVAPRRLGSMLPGLLGAWMFGVAAWAPWGVIMPAYRPPVLSAAADPKPTHVLDVDIGGQVRLLGYDIENVSAHPGEAFRFTLYWEAEDAMERNWSVFCHILDADLELPIAVRDRFPGRGLLATSLMEPGLRWTDDYVMWLEETTYAPSRAVLEVGLYDIVTQERLRIPAGQEAPGVQVVGDALRFQPLLVEPWPGELANPVRKNLGDRMAIVGWDVSKRILAPGETFELTLYWECLASMDQAYTASTQVLGAGSGKVAQADLAPGGVDTTTWRKGQQIVDRRQLTIDAAAPAGGYDLLVSVYGWEAPGQLRRLRIVDAEGRTLAAERVNLGKIRVRP